MVDISKVISIINLGIIGERVSLFPFFSFCFFNDDVHEREGPKYQNITIEPYVMVHIIQNNTLGSS